MQTSSNYGLKLPEGTDNVKRQDFVDNFTTIDTEMKKIDNKANYYGTTSGTNTYTVNINGITAYTDGLKITVKIGTTSTGASILNINGLGAKTILDNLGNAITSGGLKAGIPYNLCYNGTNFIVLGKGGGGNATADQVLEGKTFTNDSGQKTGTMPNNGALNSTLEVNGTYNIPAGYTSGGKITQNIPNRGEYQYANGVGGGSDYISFNQIPYGYYPQSNNSWAPEIRMSKSSLASYLGITSDKIVSGQSICGVSGNATIGSLGGKKYVSGSYGNGSLSINLGFRPTTVLIHSITNTGSHHLSFASPWGNFGSVDGGNFDTGTLSVRKTSNTFLPTITDTGFNIFSSGSGEYIAIG